MRRIRRILVTVSNPSAISLPAVAKAAQLAQAFGAGLRLFQVLSAPVSAAGDLPPRHLVLGALENYTRSAHEACLRAIALRLQRRGIATSVAAAWDHPAEEAILREAARIRADLIVTEARARPEGGWGMRLTDWELLRRSPVPILLVKRGTPYRRPRVLVALDPDHTFDKPASLDADILEAGIRVSAALRGDLHAVHAYARPHDAEDTAETEMAQARAAEAAGAKLERTTRGSGIPRMRLHVSGRHVPDAIEEVAAATHSALIVVGAFARSSPRRHLIGNTAERILDHVSSDILLIKPEAPQPPLLRGRRRGARPGKPLRLTQTESAVGG
ncbi:MAG: universal stress protein [Proteobacteria bacterium]|nr:universal stress protein [Pseudomonadota bacterium]